MRAATLLLAAALLLPASVVAESSVAAGARSGAIPKSSPRIAIIIDDLGHSLRRDRRALSLPTSVALAVLPHTPHSQELAEQAHAIGHEVLLHMPMESEQGANAEKIFLASSMSRDEFDLTLHKALGTVPHAVGLNNHQGSRLTEQHQPMTWLMTLLRERGDLYFVDSRTSARSLALASALDQRVPALGRTVFLDHQREPEAIVAALEQLAETARKRGRAVAIGHPYPATIATLEWALPQLAAQGIRLVPPSALLQSSPTHGKVVGAESDD